MTYWNRTAPEPLDYPDGPFDLTVLPSAVAGCIDVKIAREGTMLAHLSLNRTKALALAYHIINEVEHEDHGTNRRCAR
jgi:hypothetical protein